MRPVVLQMSVTLDGFVAPRKGAQDWRGVPEDPDLKRVKLAWVRQAGAHLMGRVTYEEMAAHWPSSSDDYAAPMNELPKVVFSKTLETADWAGARIARGDIADEIDALRREPGGDLIAYGGATFAQALVEHGLIDEFRLVINPVLIGAGLRIFRELAAPVRLQLVEASTYATGAVLHVYRPA
jgi:dihydrofolate reductase